MAKPHTVMIAAESGDENSVIVHHADADVGMIPVVAVCSINNTQIPTRSSYPTTATLQTA